MQSSFFGFNGLYHLFALSRYVRNNLTMRKYLLAISAYIGKARASFNTPLKLFEV